MGKGKKMSKSKIHTTSGAFRPNLAILPFFISFGFISLPAAFLWGQAEPLLNPDQAKQITQEVEVTGSGLNPDQALQDAYSLAIKKVVGTLVTAETEIKNEEIIRDKVLTYSRGYVESPQVLKRWQDSERHWVTIRARVKKEQVARKLESLNIPVLAVPGENIRRNIQEEITNENNAAEMVRGVLGKWHPEQMCQASIVKDVEVLERDSKKAKVGFKARVFVNSQKYEQFIGNCFRS
jgi:hypothetical protein